MNNIRTYIGATELVSSLGYSVEKHVNSIISYKSGLQNYQSDDYLSHDYIAGKIDDSLDILSTNKDYTRFERIMIAVIDSVLKKSGLSLSDEDSILIISSTKGNIEQLKENTILPDKRVYLCDAAHRIGDFFKSKHTPLVVSNACISGILAQIVASRLIRSGKYRNVIVAGGDCVTNFVISGFASFKSLSSKPCLPYDERRDGISLGEGAAAMLLTANEQLSCGVILEGGAITNDANHISGPSRTGDALCSAIQQAMAYSNLEAKDISFINAHGTATLFNDQMESKALNLAKLSDVPLNSLKPYFGHTLGAAGLIETILCVEQLKMGLVFATLGFEKLGVSDYVNVSALHREIPMQRAVKTASGFGGCNAAIVLSLANCTNIRETKETYIKDSQYSNVEVSGEPVVRTIAECIVKDKTIFINKEKVFDAKQTTCFSDFIRAAFKNLGESNLKFYKMDDLCKLGYVAAEYMLTDDNFDPYDVAIILSNSSSSLETDINHQNLILKNGDDGVSPAIFVYTLPNIVLGEICIKHKIKGENTFFITSQPDMIFMRDYAIEVLKNSQAKRAIYGWCEKFGENYHCQMTMIEFV